MPVSKKGVAYRPQRAFFVRVAVFCALGVYNLTTLVAMRSVCWLVALALTATDANVLLPSVPPCPWLPMRFGSSAGRILQSPPSVPVGTTSVVAGSCLLRSRLARFVLRLMYAPALMLWLPASYVGTTAPVRRLLRRLLLACRCGWLWFLGLFRPPLLASVGVSVGLRRGDPPPTPPNRCRLPVGCRLRFPDPHRQLRQHPTQQNCKNKQKPTHKNT